MQQKRSFESSIEKNMTSWECGFAAAVGDKKAESYYLYFKKNLVPDQTTQGELNRAVGWYPSRC